MAKNTPRNRGKQFLLITLIIVFFLSFAYQTAGFRYITLADVGHAVGFTFGLSIMFGWIPYVIGRKFIIDDQGTAPNIPNPNSASPVSDFPNSSTAPIEIPLKLATTGDRNAQYRLEELDTQINKGLNIHFMVWYPIIPVIGGFIFGFLDYFYDGMDSRIMAGFGLALIALWLVTWRIDINRMEKIGVFIGAWEYTGVLGLFFSPIYFWTRKVKTNTGAKLPLLNTILAIINLFFVILAKAHGINGIY